MEERSLPPAKDPVATYQEEAAEFTFVLNQNQGGVRSHAMREYWKRRRRRSRSRERMAIPHRPRPLLPNTQDHTQSSMSITGNDVVHSSLSRDQRDKADHPESGQSRVGTDELAALAGVPAQLLTGVDHALACSRLDPFDMFPVFLTVEHHKLLHHCE